MTPSGGDAWRELTSPRLIICTGAGGVGKTTLCAALAVVSANAGRKVACLTIDPARRLADSLGLHPDKAGGDLIDISDQLDEQRSTGGSLAVGMLDSATTFAEFVHQKASSAASAEKILNNRLYRYVSGSLSGIQEYMALEKLCQMAADQTYDQLILDTPPTANAIDFFTAPRRMKEALDGPMVRTMRHIYGRSSLLGFDFVGRWVSSLLNVLSRVTGAGLLEDIMGFVDALADLFGDFSARAEATESILKESDVTILMVTTPDRAAIGETREFRSVLEDRGFRVDGVVFNRVHWPRIEEDVPAGVSLFEKESVESLNRQWNAEHQREQDLVAQVGEVWDGLKGVYLVPIFPRGAGQIGNLERIGRSIIRYS